MTVRQLVMVGLRFFALWLCIGALQSLVYLTSAQRTNGFAQLAPSAYYIVGFLFSAAVVLWVASKALAGAVLSGVPVNEAPSPTMVNLVTAGCVLMGLWWLKDAAAGLVDSWIRAQVVASASGQSAFASMDSGARMRAAYFLGEGLLAGWLLARPFAATRLLLRQPADHARHGPMPEE
jgi:hypothetical protein